MNPLNPFGASGTGRDIIIEYNNKAVVGLTEKVIIKGPRGEKEVFARIDTGATKNSIDVRLAAELRLGPIVKAKMVNSASGSGLRPVVEAELEIANKRFMVDFTIADRSHMKYRILIGQNTLINNGFIIDPSKPEEL